MLASRMWLECGGAISGKHSETSWRPITLNMSRGEVRSPALIRSDLSSKKANSRTAFLYCDFIYCRYIFCAANPPGEVYGEATLSRVRVADGHETTPRSKPVAGASAIRALNYIRSRVLRPTYVGPAVLRDPRKMLLDDLCLYTAAARWQTHHCKKARHESGQTFAPHQR